MSLLCTSSQGERCTNWDSNCIESFHSFNSVLECLGIFPIPMVLSCGIYLLPWIRMCVEQGEIKVERQEGKIPG